MSYDISIAGALPCALIVDDEPDICYLLSTVLRQKKMDVSFATSLEGATIALQKHTPDLIFLDNHLPDGFGTEYIEHIKKNYPSSKIIMITAHDTFADRQIAMAEGVDYFISKPFSKEIIFNAVEALQLKQYNTQL